MEKGRDIMNLHPARIPMNNSPQPMADHPLPLTKLSRAPNPPRNQNAKRIPRSMVDVIVPNRVVALR